MTANTTTRKFVVKSKAGRGKPTGKLVVCSEKKKRILAERSSRTVSGASAGAVLEKRSSPAVPSTRAGAALAGTGSELQALIEAARRSDARRREADESLAEGLKILDRVDPSAAEGLRKSLVR